MRKPLAIAAASALLFPAAASAQGGKDEVRLAKLEEIVVTAAKTQPKGFAADAKTAALLAEIEKAK